MKCQAGALSEGVKPLHYGVEMGQVAQVFFVIEIGTIQLDKTPFKVFFG